MYILIALLLGVINVVSKTINYKATVKIGSLSGSIMNYIEASLISLFIILITSEKADLSLDIPWFLYFGGLFGAIAFFFNITSLSKMNLFMSTIIVLIGQLIGSICIDYFLGISITPLKLLGIIIMLIGIIIDKKLTLTE